MGVAVCGPLAVVARYALTARSGPPPHAAPPVPYPVHSAGVLAVGVREVATYERTFTAGDAGSATEGPVLVERVSQGYASLDLGPHSSRAVRVRP